MNPNKPPHEFIPNPAEHQSSSFAEKLETLLPGVRFEESERMREAREVITDALKEIEQSASLPVEAWLEYDKPFKEMIDAVPSSDSGRRAQLHIAKLVHKALIFDEAGHKQRCFLDLQDASEYAYNMGFDDIDEALSIQMDKLIEQ